MAAFLGNLRNVVIAGFVLAILLVGIVVVALKSGTLQIEDVRGTKSLLGAALIALGLAVKVPLVPLHTWLPDAHAKAPTHPPVSNVASETLHTCTYAVPQTATSPKKTKTKTSPRPTYPEGCFPPV